MTFTRGKRLAATLFFVCLTFFCFSVLPRVAINSFYYPDSHLYHPQPPAAEHISFTAKDGTQLSGWFIPSSTGEPRDALATVIHAHGNVGNMSAHWPLVSWLPEENVNVFMFDYRGFGESQGIPSPEGLCDDTLSAIEYVRQRQDIDPQRIVLLGQSLGGNNVLAALGRGGKNPGIRAVILDSTFYSYSSIANQMIPGSGILLDDSYSAERYIANVSPIPLLILHGGSDHVVPVEHSQRLFAMAGEPKKLIIIPQGDHIDAFSDRYHARYRNETMRFMKQALSSQN